MKKYLLALVLVLGFSTIGIHSGEATSVAQRLAGRILLQVESHGEAWYVHPTELVRYYLGRPDDAFAIMRAKGVGITNANLDRIAKSDSTSTGDRVFAQKLSGRILLQVQANGEAWYVYPVTLKRYYLGRPADAFAVMRTLGLGVTDNDLGAILTKTPTSVSSGTGTGTADQYASQRTTIITELNKQRVSEGVSAVKESSLLSAGAQAHADDMTAKGYFSLTSPNGTKATDRILAVGYKPKSVGLWLDSVSTGASDFISKWMLESPADFASVGLNNNFREVGVGVATVDGKRTYVLILALSESDYLQDYTASLADLSKVRNDMLARVNAERQKAGVASLSANDMLMAEAQTHADDMKTNGYYSHTSLDGSNIGDRTKAQGYDYAIVGENIAKGQRSVQEVMDGWMASQGHRENILDTKFADFGMGLSFGNNKNGYEIIWTQAFGSKR